MEGLEISAVESSRRGNKHSRQIRKDREITTIQGHEKLIL